MTRLLAAFVLAFGALLLPIAAEPAGLARPTCLGKAATKVGTEKDDTLLGTDRADVIVGLGGDDHIRGFGGNDLICGGPGNDLLTGDDGNDRLSGDSGQDIFFPAAGSDSVLGGSGSDTIGFPFSLRGVTADLGAGKATGEGADALRSVENVIGSDFADVLSGNSDNNLFLPQAGDDLVQGRGGFDFAFFDSHVTASLATHSSVGEGRDTLAGLEGLGGSEDTTGRYELTGDGNDNVLLGGGGNDVLDGGGGSDRLGGAVGNDVLHGGNGDDILNGGAGDDRLAGDEGIQDSVTYLDAGAGVRVDLGKGEASGAGSDSLSGVEGASGSRFADRLIGDAGANNLFGQQGNDMIQGGAGPDFLGGGQGRNDLGAGAGQDYCLSGRSSACELRTLPGRVPGAPSKPPGEGRPVSAPSLFDTVVTLLRQVGPKGGAGGSSRSFEYWAAPACRSSGGVYTTEISPPRSVQPVGARGKDEFASWKATLYRYAGSSHSWKKQKGFGWARAQIAGPRVRGVPVWRSRRGAVVVKLPVRVPKGRYAWVADLYWSKSQTSLRNWVEPHLVYAPSGALSYHNSCTFPSR